VPGPTKRGAPGWPTKNGRDGEVDLVHEPGGEELGVDGAATLDHEPPDTAPGRGRRAGGSGSRLSPVPTTVASPPRVSRHLSRRRPSGQVDALPRPRCCQNLSVGSRSPLPVTVTLSGCSGWPLATRAGGAARRSAPSSRGFVATQRRGADEDRVAAGRGRPSTRSKSPALDSSNRSSEVSSIVAVDGHRAAQQHVRGWPSEPPHPAVARSAVADTLPHPQPSPSYDGAPDPATDRSPSGHRWGGPAARGGGEPGGRPRCRRGRTFSHAARTRPGCPRRSLVRRRGRAPDRTSSPRSARPPPGAGGTGLPGRGPGFAVGDAIWAASSLLGLAVLLSRYGWLTEVVRFGWRGGAGRARCPVGAAVPGAGFAPAGKGAAPPARPLPLRRADRAAWSISANPKAAGVLHQSVRRSAAGRRAVVGGDGRRWPWSSAVAGGVGTRWSPALFSSGPGGPARTAGCAARSTQVTGALFIGLGLRLATAG